MLVGQVLAQSGKSAFKLEAFFFVTEAKTYEKISLEFWVMVRE
jgi:hypothetical protein